MEPVDRKLTSLQWQLNILTAVLSAVAIGLFYADLRDLSRLTLVLVALAFFCSVGIAISRYRRNKKRREEILAKFEQDRNVKLEELFDQARRLQNLPPDSADENGFRATLKATKEKAQNKKSNNRPEPRP